jgi:sugar lactone lactonase YvrE
MGFSLSQTHKASRLTGALWPCAAAVAVVLMSGCGGHSTSNNAAPTITSFLATPATIAPGGTANLVGVFPLLSNGNTPFGTIMPGAYAVSSGTQVPVSPLVTTTYTLTVSNQTGMTVSQSVTVTVGSVAPASLEVLAGLPSGAGNVNGVASAAKFNFPASVAVDASGNAYVADTQNHCIRLVSPSGAVTTFAGNPGHPGSADGLGTAASFNAPYGVAVAGNGYVYVADTGNSTVRMITPAGQVTTLAGLAGQPGLVNGPAASATFNQPYALAVDGNLNVYLADSYNHAVRMISVGGVVSTLAGTGSAGHVDGAAGSASFNTPMGVAVDASGNVYVADTGNATIRRLSSGVVSTLAGTAGSTGSVDGTGAAARFAEPTGLAVAGTTLFVADTLNQVIRTVNAAGLVTTVAGTAGSFGDSNALGILASFYNPMGLALDASSNLYVADSLNNLVRTMTPQTAVTNYAGVAGAPTWLDGTGVAVRFNNPTGIAISETNTIYVADASNNVIRQLSAAGVSSTLAGTAMVVGSHDGTGPAASFNQPCDLAVNGAGDLIVLDAGNQTVREITAAGVVTTLAGVPGTTGFLNGTAATATFNHPSALALDQLGNIYVADTGNGAIREISTAGEVSTLVTGFSDIQGLVLDAADNLYIADAGTQAIYIMAPSQTTPTVLAGIPGTAGSTDGAALSATFNHPTRLTLDPSGNLYITDAYNDTIRMLTPAGVVSTVVGVAGTGSIVPGNLPGALADPSGIAFDATTGLLYICAPDTILVTTF